MDAEDLLGFWFGAPGQDGRLPWRAAWFTKDAAFDAALSARYGAAWAAVRGGALTHWCAEPRACVAYLLLADQVPRNIHRGRPEAFVTDALALAAAREALERGHDRAVAPALRLFIYLPFEHSEDLADQDRAVALLEALEPELPGSRAGEWARRHREVVARFGRFPHRNEFLGRASTAEEIAFLREHGSRF